MIRKVMLLLFISAIFLEADSISGEWKTFEYFDKNPFPTAYQLKKNIAYIEIRRYETDSDYKTVVKKGYEVIWKAYRKPLENFPQAVIHRFKAALPNFSEESDRNKYNYFLTFSTYETRFFVTNAFYIDMQGHIWRMNTKEDIIAIILPIDNTADLNALMWLKKEPYARIKSYRKTYDGYEVKFVEDHYLNADKKKCGDYTYTMTVSKDGKFGKKKLKHFKHQECIQA